MQPSAQCFKSRRDFLPFLTALSRPSWFYLHSATMIVSWAGSPSRRSRAASHGWTSPTPSATRRTTSPESWSFTGEEPVWHSSTIPTAAIETACLHANRSPTRLKFSRSPRRAAPFSPKSTFISHWELPKSSQKSRPTISPRWWASWADALGCSLVYPWYPSTHS